MEKEMQLYPKHTYELHMNCSFMLKLKGEVTELTRLEKDEESPNTSGQID